MRSFLVVPSRADEGPERVLARLFDLGRSAVVQSELGWDAIDGIGIGCGGPLDAEPYVAYLKAKVAEIYGVRV